MKRALAYFPALLIALSCSKENRFDCFKPNGAATTEIRTFARFDSIEVRDNFDVTLSKGSAYSVDVTAGKHIIKNISSQVRNGQLVIENRNKCNAVRGYKRRIKIHVTTPYIKKLYNNSVGPVTFDDNFKQDTLFIKAESTGDTYINGTYKVVYSSSSGNGDINLKGSSGELHIYSNGTNYTRAGEFRVTDFLHITTNSIGDAYLNLDGLDKFEYAIWNDGSINYTGTPKNIKELSDGLAKGKVIKKD